MEAIAPAEIVVSGGDNAPFEARGALMRQFSDDLARECVETARLLVSEIVTNSVVHGGVGADGWVRTSVEVEGGYLRVEVRDSATRRAPAPRAPDRVNGGGFGLYLVDRMSSSWGVETDPELYVWFEIPAASDRAFSPESP